MNHARIWTVLIVLAGAAAARAQFENVELGPRYRDPLNGFSLRPPADAAREKSASPTRLVSWKVADPKSRAVAWQLTVQHLVVDRSEPVDVDTYAKTLQARMESAREFKVESVKTDDLAGKRAIHVLGQTTGALRFWQWQVYVLSESQRFLVFTISGPMARKQELSRIGKKILATMEFNDVVEFRKRQKEKMDNGRAFLKRLTEQDLADAIETDPQWFLLLWDGEVAGWMQQREGSLRLEGRDGYYVHSWAQMKLPEVPIRVMKREWFSSPDRSFDRWSEYLQQGEGSKAFSRLEDAVKEQDQVLVDFAINGKIVSSRYALELDIYLPKVHEALIWRLITLDDRREQSAPRGYVFGTYNSEHRRLDMRSIRLAGTEPITVNGRRYVADRLEDQKHYDQGVNLVWVDKQGRLLRMKTESGLSIERASRQQVLNSFPRAVDVMQALNTASEKTRRLMREGDPSRFPGRR